MAQGARGEDAPWWFMALFFVLAGTIVLIASKQPTGPDRSHDTTLVICGEVVDTAVGYIGKDTHNTYRYAGPDGLTRTVPRTCVLREMDYSSVRDGGG